MNQGGQHFTLHGNIVHLRQGELTMYLQLWLLEGAWTQTADTSLSRIKNFILSFHPDAQEFLVLLFISLRETQGIGRDLAERDVSFDNVPLFPF